MKNESFWREAARYRHSLRLAPVVVALFAFAGVDVATGNPGSFEKGGHYRATAAGNSLRKAGVPVGNPLSQSGEPRNLLAAGIRCVINLVEEEEKGSDGQPLRPYYPLLAKSATEEDIDITYHRIPIRDVDVPSRATMEAILDAINGAHSREQPVYVHCWGAAEAGQGP